MLDDSRLRLGELYYSDAELKSAMIDVAHHTQDRGSSQRWASRLRLLTADTVVYPGQSRTMDSSDGSESGNSSVEPPAPGSPSAESITSEQLCSCMTHPSRELAIDEHALMLAGTEDLLDCVHYVAISYCWQGLAKARYTGPSYTIRSKGSVQAPYCPPALLKRAVAFTSNRGLRHMWIDQECIDQNDAYDKGTGIQAMDLVYQNAEFSLAVLTVCITEQRHLDALALLMESSGDGINADQLGDLIEALEIITSDPWFERAWCLQESASGARRMTLSVRYKLSLKVHPVWFGSDIEYFAGNLPLDLPQLHNLISSWLVFQISILPNNDADGLKSRCNDFMVRWSRIMPPDVNAEYYGGDRTTCNASEAMWYLSRRLNTVVSDRLAILANLCDYDVRLNADALEKAGYGFSICALTLAILNGDFSPMAGLGSLHAGHQVKDNDLVSSQKTLPGLGFSWSLPGTTALDSLPFRDKESDVLRIKTNATSLDTGLQIRGCLWVVDQLIDLSHIKHDLMQQYGYDAISETLNTEHSFPLDTKDHIRRVRFDLMTRFMRLLVTSTYVKLAKHLWNRLRFIPNPRLLETQGAKLQAYAESSFEEIVDFDSMTIKWKNPISSLLDGHDREDPFHSLEGRFVGYITHATLVDARLPVGRILCRQNDDHAYSALFDGAALSDQFFTPASNYGFSAPDQEYLWYPMTWRVSEVEPTSGDSKRALRTHGLICGSWTATEGDAEVVTVV